MSRKSQFPRLRRSRLMVMAASPVAVLGASAAISAVPDAIHQRPGGMIGVIVGIALLATGLGGVILAARAGGRVAALERQELRSAGLDDGLPKGAFVQGQRVGLEASDKWMVAGALAVGAGLLFAVWGALDPQVGWKVGLAFGCVGFLPAAFFMWVGPGTKFWLTSDGIESCLWSKRYVRWSEVERVVPLRRGSPSGGFHDADAIELLLPPAARGWSRFSGVNKFTIQCQLLEVSTRDLALIIQERVDLAHRRL